MKIYVVTYEGLELGCRTETRELPGTSSARQIKRALQKERLRKLNAYAVINGQPAFDDRDIEPLMRKSSK